MSICGGRSSRGPSASDPYREHQIRGDSQCQPAGRQLNCSLVASWPWPRSRCLPLVGNPADWAEWCSRGQIIGGTKQIAGVQPVGGFLPNPSLLNPGGAGQADLVYRSPVANFGSYNKIILEPVAIWAPPDSQLNTVPVEQRQAVTNTFYSDLYNALSKRCQMVTSLSPGTMRMRFVLVDAKIPNSK